MIKSIKAFYPIAVLCLLTAISISGWAQNINGDKIQVAADALTVLKFNSEIKRYELGDREGYTCQVRDNDNSIVIKTIGENPAATNLIVIEGKRSHYFLIEYLPKIDINNTKLFYDFSDLKELKKKVKNNEEQPGTVALNSRTSGKAEKEEPAAKETKQERKAREKEAKRLEEEKQQRLREEAKAAQMAKDKEAAAAKEQERLRAAEADRARKMEEKNALAQAQAKEAEQQRIKAEKDKAAQTAKDRELALAKAKEIKRLEAEEKTRQQQRDKEIAQAKTEERQRLMDEEKKRKLQQQREIDEAKMAEKQRLADEQEAKRIAREKEQAELMEKEKIRLAEEQKAKVIEKEIADAKEKERKRLLDEENEKKRAAERERNAVIEAEKTKLAAEQKAKQHEKDSIIAREKERLALVKRYPGINFYEPPNGQKLTGEYFRPVDTAENFYVSSAVLKENSRVHQGSDTVKGVSMELQGIWFSGVNAYARLLIRNNSSKELALGRMNLQWFKKNGTNYNLFACYVTGFPILAAGKDVTIVYVTRAVNAQDSDTFSFTMHDRLEKLTIEFPISGELYNKEMSRHQR